MASWLAYVRCPDHGPRCGGRACCCRSWHWRPVAYLRFTREFERSEEMRQFERVLREMGGTSDVR